MEAPLEFDVNDGATRASRGGVFNVDLIPDRKQFIIAQTHGRVSLFNLTTCERIAIVNGVDWVEKTRHLGLGSANNG